MTDIDRAIEEAKADVLPFESWERLPKETGLAFSAFRSFRDLGLERTVRKAVEAAEKDVSQWDKRYRVWRNWCSLYRWRERAAEYDRYIECLKQAELRKTIEEQGKQHRAVTCKMLTLVEKKLDMMSPAELDKNDVPEWADKAVRVDRGAPGLAAPNGNTNLQQEELPFGPDFNGI